MAKVELNLTANATDLLNDLNRTEQELKNIQGDAAKMGVSLNKAFAGGEAGAKEFNQEIKKTEGVDRAG